jgi:NADH-quinone oxidoreductase subunit F
MTFEELRTEALAEWEAVEKSNKPRIMVGSATCGRASGALGVLEAIKDKLAQHSIEAIIMQVGCIGTCYAEPIIDIVKPRQPHIFYSNVSQETAAQLVDDYILNNNPRPDIAMGTAGEGAVAGIPRLFDLPMLKPQVRIVLRNCGFIDPENINHYIANGGYAGLVKALSLRPEEVIEEIKKSGLRGRGGAGFPAGLKWEFCRKSPGNEKYIICNADEGDPGAFMNRSLLEGDPHSVLEGLLIGAYAIGATKGYIYCRAEKPLAIERTKVALKKIQEKGLVGANILGSGFSFEIELREGAGAFVCGEETALIASIEGKRGMPQTWANAAAILQRGSEWYSQYGTEKSKGTKTFALAGKIKRTGLIEVPIGISLREIVYDIGGGILDDKKFKAVQTGGPSGGCIPEPYLDQPVDYETLAKLGAIVGSGGMIVMDEDTCMVDVARFFMSFIQSESCGKCVPCRMGTKHMLDILTRITSGKGLPGDIELLLSLAENIKAGSLCGLGQTSPNPVITTLRYFRDEYEAHINSAKCPAHLCKDLINYVILPEKCQGCGICLRNCPATAIVGDKRMVHVIDQSKCVKCGTCQDVCPSRFSAIVKFSGEKIVVPDKPTPVVAARPGAKPSGQSAKE